MEIPSHPVAVTDLVRNHVVDPGKSIVWGVVSWDWERFAVVECSSWDRIFNCHFCENVHVGCVVLEAVSKFFVRVNHDSIIAVRITDSTFANIFGKVKTIIFIWESFDG